MVVIARIEYHATAIWKFQVITRLDGSVNSVEEFCDGFTDMVTLKRVLCGWGYYGQVLPLVTSLPSSSWSKPFEVDPHW
jgi:hypothetical protein